MYINKNKNYLFIFRITLTWNTSGGISLITFLLKPSSIKISDNPLRIFEERAAILLKSRRNLFKRGNLLSAVAGINKMLLSSKDKDSRFVKPSKASSSTY